ncbi:GNAT family N-acetyltransferase, partial [Edwardsiella ictaluri]|nr:GNAT family N-acetyltransferase [Edwardsiella ictaluri]
MTDQPAPDIRIRPLTAADNGAIADVIRRVSAECGLSADKGFTVSDPNLDRLAQ